MSTTRADQIIQFNRQLNFTGQLPPPYHVINPFRNNTETIKAMIAFYRKYYNDTHKRKFIIAINPGRHGAAVTGVPLTDTKRLEGICGIQIAGTYTHEVSSVFMYDVIAGFGGADAFFQQFYINSLFPLAIVKDGNNGKIANANYYDTLDLIKATQPFIISSLQQQINLGIDTSVAFILGKKNAEFIRKLNDEYHFFDHIVMLEHPRYIEQYKSKERLTYIDKYIHSFKQNY
ncbi:MAG: uracil-DNA glycosylase family protein [Marinifilaceae bacterium]